MGWYDVVKDAISVAHKAGNLDLYEKLIDLEHGMQDMQHENFELREQLKCLRDSLNLESEMKVSEDRKFFYRVHNGETIGLYCPVCWQKDKKLSFLQPEGNNYFWCSLCHYEAVINNK